MARFGSAGRPRRKWNDRNGPGAIIFARLIAELVPARSRANLPVVQP
jgi:hypothetical protein